MKFTAIPALLLGMAIVLAGSGLLVTLLGIGAHDAGFSAPLIGAIMSGFYLGYIIGTWFVPRLIHRIGYIRSFAVLSAMASISALLHGLWVDPWVWLALRIINGTALLGLYMVVESWLNVLTRTHRGQIFGVYMLVTLLALGLGQFLIDLYGAHALASFVLVGLLFTLGLVPVALTRAAQPEPIRTERLTTFALFKAAPAGVIGATLSGTLTGALWGMSAVYANHIGLSDAEVGLFVALLIFGGALLQWPLGRWSDRIDRRYMLIGIAGAAMLASLLMMLLNLSCCASLRQSLLWPIALLFGGFVFSLYGISVAQTHDRLPSEQTLEATRTLLLLNGIGALLGPLLAGMLMAYWGAIGFPSFILLGSLLLIILVVNRLWLDAPVPKDERQPFILRTRTSTAAADFDPQTPASEDEVKTRI